MYRVLQLTNTNIGAVAEGGLLPLGTITRRVNRHDCGQKATFGSTTTLTDTIIINEAGNYRVTYNGSLTADAAGTLDITLVQNADDVYTSSATAPAGTPTNITLIYEIRVLPDAPVNIQFKLGGVALTDGVANALIERVY